MEQTLDTLVNDIIADGKVDENEVEALKDKIYADGKVDREEAEAIYKIIEGTAEMTYEETPLSWVMLAAEVVGDYLLADDDTPNVIDSEECEWFVDITFRKGKVHRLKQIIFYNLMETAEEVHGYK